MSNRILRMLIVLLLFNTAAKAQRVFTTIEPTEIIESLKFDVNSVPVGENVVEYNRAGTTGSTVDLNFSPNVVFLPDSEKAFVSFSGSDKVMAFNPKTGEILRFIEVGSNPASLTLSPDGKTVGVVSVFLQENLPSRESQGAQTASVVMIDSDTYQTRTLVLNDVFLSIANNIVFSKDGTQGFVPSMGTDQLIRFDVDTLEEISPRLQFTPGSRAAGATLIPNTGLVAVVLIGSTNLSRIESPDSIALVDPDSFQVTENIFPLTGSQYADENGNFDVLHDFKAFNNFAVSEDGRYGLIADQQLSSIGSVPELSTDRAWLYDFESGHFAPGIDVGGISAGAYYAPDGQFVVVGSFVVSLVKPEPVDENTEITARRITPSRVDYRAGSRPAFTHDGTTMYLASPSNDSVLVFDLETGEVTDAIDVGGGVERRVTSTVGEETTTSVVVHPSGPLDLGITPDGEVITVLNFNENTIDLMKNTFRFAVPRVISTRADEDEDESLTFFTALAISNLTSLDVEVEATAYSRGGIPFRDDTNTEDIVEIENPSTLSIGSEGQVFDTVDDLLSAVNPAGGGGVGDNNQDEGDAIEENDRTSALAILDTAWLDLDSDSSDTAGIFFVGDRGLKRLEGSSWVSEGHNRILIPEVRLEDGMLTEVSVVNPNLTTKTVYVELYNDRGQLVGRYTRTLAGNGMLSEFVGSPGEDIFTIPVMFQDVIFEPCHSVPGDQEEDENQNEDEEDSEDLLGCGFERGYIIVTTDLGDGTEEEINRLGVIAYEQYFDEDRLSALGGLPILDPPSPATRFYVPQVIAFQGCSTYINLVNPTKEWINIELYLKDDQGQDLVAPATLTLRSGHSIRPNIVDLFGLTDTGSLVSGYLVIEADGPGLMGDAELRLFADKAMTTVALADSPSEELVFPYVPGGPGFFTGLGLVNTTSSAANVSIQIVSAEGDFVYETSIVLPPNARVSQMLTEYAEEFGLQNSAYIKVFSDQPIVGLESFFTGDFELVSSVEAQ